MTRKPVFVGLGIVVALVAAYVGAAAWSGQKTESLHREWLARLQAQAPFLKLTGQSYRKGFLAASASTSFQIGCAPAADKAPPVVTITETIHHGPFASGTIAAAVIDAQVSLAGEDGTRLAAKFTGPPLSVHTVVNFGGRFTSTVSSATARFPMPGGAEVAWQGLTGTLEAGSEPTGPFSYRLKMPGLALTDAARGMSARLAGLDIQVDGSFVGGAGRLVVGKSRGSVEAMELAMTMPAATKEAARPVSVAFTGMTFESETSIADQLMAVRSTFGGAGLVNGARIERFDMQASMKRLHAPTYEHLVDRMSSASAACDGGKDASPAALMAQMQTDLMALAAFNPEFALDKLTVDYAGKRGEFSYALGLQGVTAADTRLPPMAMLMTRAHATAAMRLPVAWIRQLSQEGSTRLQGAVPAPAVVDAMVDQAVDSGHMVRDGDYVRSSLDFSAGTMTVNGKVVSGAGKGR
jgi:uncharacterized protein YdgA (DUF945 family)